MREVIVVGHIDNTNGMATWCWEAAHALHQAGLPVVLTVADGVRLPGDAEMPLVVLPTMLEAAESLSASRLTKYAERLHRLFVAHPNHYLATAVSALTAVDLQPTLFVLNNGSFVNQVVSIPQFVAGWSYPVDLFDYLAKRDVLSRGSSLKKRIGVVLDLIAIWRSDWRAYREATETLAVSQRLKAALSRRGIKASCVYPCTRSSPAHEKVPQRPPKLLFAAESLDDPRKGVRWMLETLAQHEDLPECELILVGGMSEELRLTAGALPCPVKFLGKLRRDELQSIMAECDIFCFASAMDDWGYVLSEALANGLIPIAPDQSPFDEIVSSAGYVYEPRNASAFLSCVEKALRLNPTERVLATAAARAQAEENFSPDAFIKSLQHVLEIVNHSMVTR